MGHAIVGPDKTVVITATLVSTKAVSNSIRTFNFNLSSPTEVPLPGGFGVFDFSDILDVGYNHMNEVNPQLVNEDYVRTWTLSNAPDFDTTKNAFSETSQVSVTVKRKPGGLISNVLHDHAEQLIAQKLPISFKGIGAGFTCFSKPDDALPSLPAQMLWIAGGVGITPFITMWDGICKIEKARPSKVLTDIVLLFSGHDDDVKVLTEFASQQGSPATNVKLSISAFQSTKSATPVAKLVQQDQYETFPTCVRRFEERRIEIDDIRSVPDLKKREVFMCGPETLMSWSAATLTKLDVKETQFHLESFIF